MNEKRCAVYRFEPSGLIRKFLKSFISQKAFVVFTTWLRAGSQEEVSQSSRVADEEDAVWLKNANVN